ncbi:MAG: single-stranded DNA-binding protein [bacterium]|nr:single-stranded DNA-binding protein [bacterium]
MKSFVGEVDDLNLLMDILPEKIRTFLEKHNSIKDLNEIILDLGRIPEIRFIDSVEKLTLFGEVKQSDLKSVVEKTGVFNSDNRAGIERTLHRISAICNRSGIVIGLTCRVGRAVYGTTDIIKDIIKSGKNVLFLGVPGIGKTTKLRETARLLSDELFRRVIVVDTSNEIAGDGDICHPGIGSARRMQVPSPDKQHAVMIEAVENHMPEVIIVDEIGTEEEARAARTIAERGVQLIATAHGYSIENLLKNPTLSDLLGGLQSVILGDEEAKFRGTQKTVMERKALPTFDILIEIRERDVFAIYKNVQQAVDNYLRSENNHPEIRKREDTGNITVLKSNETVNENDDFEQSYQYTHPEQVISIFPFGINQDRISMAIEVLAAPAVVAQNISEADIILTIQSHVKTKSKIHKILQGRQVSVHVIKRNSTAQIEKFLRDFFNLSATEDDKEQEAVQEIKQVCKKVLDEGRTMEAAPRNSYFRRLQHRVVDKSGLNSLSTGEEPNRRVRVYPRH